MRVRAGAFGRSFVVACLVVGVLQAVPAAAQEPASHAPAAELLALMEGRKLDAVAARHPSGPNTFVAALHFPGQLLVVWADYSVPVLINEKLLNGDYRDVYIDLNSASDPATKTLVTDMGANGLRPRRDGDAFDMQDSGTRTIRFDGRWREQKLSEQEYMKIYQESDAAYADALRALVAELKGR
jgi:hypothetical protein